MTITIYDAQTAANHQLEISRIINAWAAFRRHPGSIEIIGWDSDGFHDALRMPAFAVAETVRQRLQRQIVDLTREISSLGIEPDVVALPPMPEPVESKKPAMFITGF